MQSIRLSVARRELLLALKTLGRGRRRRLRPNLPVWLRFIAEAGELQIVEDHGQVSARVPASGDWPVTGATVDLFGLRRAAADLASPTIDLHATLEGVMVVGDNWHVRLNLLRFGPDSDARDTPAPRPRPVLGPQGLPLFDWALGRSPSGGGG
jgi:hypothetical protein